MRMLGRDSSAIAGEPTPLPHVPPFCLLRTAVLNGGPQSPTKPTSKTAESPMIKKRIAFILASLLVGCTTRLVAQQGDRGTDAALADLDPAIARITPPAPFRTVDEELKTFKVAPGFRVEVVAIEPLVQEPVAMQFAPDGKLWVVEMRAYMMDVDGKGENDLIGDIVVLEDTNKDGRYDKRTVFVDKLDSPRAVSLVDGGALVAAPPFLWYYKDTNGDGVADQKTEIGAYGNLSGPEHNSNGLMWGLDNWIYSANHTVRYRYEGGGKFSSGDTITRGQWAITQDDVGRLYYNSNSDPLRVDLLPSAYLRRNPGFQAAGTNIAPQTTPLTIYPSRPEPGINRGYQGLNPDGTYSSVTSATGTMVYRGTLFPKEFSNDVFIAEPTANLVKRIKMEEVNGTLTARNAYPEGSEFLTSTDERFRPVTMYNGPDGALYIIDMYHGIIQHKNFVTTYLRKQILDRKLDAPIHVGRIFRVVPTTAPARPAMADLSRSTPAQLVTALGDANGWTRDTAQRLLVERADAGAIPLLKAMLAPGKSGRLGRLHALWTLDGVGGLDAATVLTAMKETDRKLRSNAVRLSERWLRSEPGGDIEKAVIALATDKQREVRVQVAFSLGEGNSSAVHAAQLAMLTAAPGDIFVVDAVLSGMRGREMDALAALRADPAWANTNPGRVRTLRTLAQCVTRAREPEPVSRLLASIAVAAAKPVDGGPSLDWTTGPTGKRKVTLGWQEWCLLEGMFTTVRFGSVPPIRLDSEPTAFTSMLTHPDKALQARIKEVVDNVIWPGKAGVEVAAPAPLTTEEGARFERGRQLYASDCAACHQSDGLGQRGRAPPLLGSAWVLRSPELVAKIVLAGVKGPIKVHDDEWKMEMPSLAHLDDDALAAILTYVRRAWGNSADPVVSGTIADVRKVSQDRKAPWSAKELDASIK